MTSRAYNFLAALSMMAVFAAIHAGLQTPPEARERPKTRRQYHGRLPPFLDHPEPMDVLYQQSLHGPGLSLFFRHLTAVIMQTLLAVSNGDHSEKSGYVVNDVTDPKGQAQLSQEAKKVWNTLGLIYPDNITGITAGWSLEKKILTLSVAGLQGVRTVNFLQFGEGPGGNLKDLLLKNSEFSKRESVRKTFRNLHEQIQLSYYFHPVKENA